MGRSEKCLTSLLHGLNNSESRLLEPPACLGREHAALVSRPAS
jgi:hypothetical protein